MSLRTNVQCAVNVSCPETFSRYMSASFTELSPVRLHAKDRWKQRTNKQKVVHANEQPFVCIYCSDRFNQKYDFMVHLRLHAKDRSIQRINKQKVVHTNERPFVCIYCSERFNQKDDFMVHLRLHAQDRSNSLLKVKVFSNTNTTTTNWLQRALIPMRTLLSKLQQL